jgi:hypothetical protein
VNSSYEDAVAGVNAESRGALWQRHTDVARRSRRREWAMATKRGILEQIGERSLLLPGHINRVWRPTIG